MELIDGNYAILLLFCGYRLKKRQIFIENADAEHVNHNKPYNYLHISRLFRSSRYHNKIIATSLKQLLISRYWEKWRLFAVDYLRALLISRDDPGIFRTERRKGISEIRTKMVPSGTGKGGMQFCNLSAAVVCTEYAPPVVQCEKGEGKRRKGEKERKARL